MYAIIGLGIVVISSLDFSISLSFHFVSKNKEKINSILALNIMMGILCFLIIIPWLVFALTQLIKNWNVSVLTIGILVWIGETLISFTIVVAILMISCKEGKVVSYEPMGSKIEEHKMHYIS